MWNLSSVEPVALEYSRYNYNATDFYDSGPYRSSDHDPLVVGLDLPIGPVATSTAASVTPDPARMARSTGRWSTCGSARTAGVVDGGAVEVRELGFLLGRGTVRDGTAEITLPRYVIPGGTRCSVRYLGTADTRALARPPRRFTVVLTAATRESAAASLRR